MKILGEKKKIKIIESYINIVAELFPIKTIINANKITRI